MPRTWTETACYYFTSVLRYQPRATTKPGPDPSGMNFYLLNRDGMTKVVRRIWSNVRNNWHSQEPVSHWKLMAPMVGLGYFGENAWATWNIGQAQAFVFTEDCFCSCKRWRTSRGGYTSTVGCFLRALGWGWGAPWACNIGKQHTQVCSERSFSRWSSQQKGPGGPKKQVQRPIGYFLVSCACPDWSLCLLPPLPARRQQIWRISPEKYQYSCDS